jgi:LEA14-like dessication related protein
MTAGLGPICRSLLLAAAGLTLSGCAVLRGGLETPNVTVSSFRVLPSEGMLPAFEVGLRIINPNSVALNLRGVSYTVSLDGNEIIKGVANNLPVIEAYGEGEIKLTAAANMFAGMRLVRDLLSNNKDRFDYALEAKLDVGKLLPAIRVTDSGSISLSGAGGGG